MYRCKFGDLTDLLNNFITSSGFCTEAITIFHWLQHKCEAKDQKYVLDLLIKNTFLICWSSLDPRIQGF